jgi:hypothetical protein
MNKILVGGSALVKLGSKRHTDDTDYLINDSSSKNAFSEDKENNIDYLNANGNDFFSEIYNIEKGNEIASPQSLLELKAYALVQHCKNGYYQKADDCEYDMKFLVRKFNLTEIKIVNQYLGEGEISEIVKIINTTK